MNIDPKNIISLTEARKRLFTIAQAIQKPDTYYMFTDKGRPKAIMMSAEEFDSWQETVDIIVHNPGIFEEIKGARKAMKEGRTIPIEEVFPEMAYVLADKGKKSYVARRPRSKGKKKAS